MNSRKLAGASAASVGAATAVAALLLGTLSGSAGEEPTAAAFGIAAEGLVPISPTPFVQAPPDGRKALLEVPGPRRDGLYVGLLRVEAEGYRSKATAVNVNVLGLRLKVIEAFCDHGHGGSSILGSDGQPSSYSGAGLNISPVVKVEFNRQRRDRDELTVDGAVITLLPGDRYGTALTLKDLGLFQSLAPKSLKIPSMDQLQAAHDKVSNTKSAAPKSGTPTKVSEESSPTVGDLAREVQLLNPSLSTLIDGPRALERIVITSARCREEHHESRPPERKQEAPAPSPVKAHLPVTH